MCGIAGVVQIKNGDQLPSRDDVERILRGFDRDLRHRGPDDRGYLISRKGNAALLNTRLAIIDLTDCGHQPMSTADGRYHIVYNGEIYNYGLLRSRLLANGYSLRSNSDTEVILALYATEGPKCVHLLEGMFAFAIWDEIDQRLFLARDPLGIKPLYYSERGGRIVFASELRPLVASGMVSKELCWEGLSGYLLYGTVPEPRTLLDECRMLPAGHYLDWHDGISALTRYWDIQFGADEVSRDAAVKTVRAAVQESVERHLVSDVPVGVLLSGGIDSTAVLALAARTQRDLFTLSIHASSTPQKGTKTPV